MKLCYSLKFIYLRGNKDIRMLFLSFSLVYEGMRECGEGGVKEKCD